jgi:hypothetical protein
MPHIGYEGIVYADVDAASHMAFRACLWSFPSLRRLDHVSHSETIGALLADYDRTQVLSFECYYCVLLRISNLIFRALVCSVSISDLFENGRLLCFIFGQTSTSGWLLQWSLSQWVARIGMVWSQCGLAANLWIFQRFEQVVFFELYILFFSNFNHCWIYWSFDKLNYCVLKGITPKLIIIE